MAGRGQVRMANGPTRYLLIGAGSVCVALGALGVVLPLLPTTPFLLLAAACYLRSSHRFHTWLLGHRVLGAYIRDYLSGQGIPARAKVFTIGLLWLTIGFSAIVVVEMTAIRILLLTIALGVTAHLLMIRTARR
jgi:uncharacterized protein